MTDDQEAGRFRARAEDLLRSRTIGDAPVNASGRVESPVAVLTPSGQLHSWFVPVTVGDRLAGFVQFMPDGAFMRFSSFQRRAGDLAGCPVAADWLDSNRIKGRAEALRRPDETSGDPFLTYDKVPDRLAWAVPLTGADGTARLVYVVGETVYESASDESGGHLT
jgi:hypothetical protein